MAENNLTPGELLLVERKRNGLSQYEAGAVINVSRSTWSKWERDLIIAPVKTTLRFPLSAAEESMIKRRRKGFTQKDVAEQVGCSRYWVSQMETGAVETRRLEEFWN